MKIEEEGQPQKHECCKSLNAIEDALYVIGGKWKLRITLALIDGSKRFNELQRLLQTISPRVLSHELKELELNGFVQRKVYATEMPVVVEYQATEYSLTLKKVLDALVEWGTMHKEKIKEISAPSLTHP
ncbi:helix-turn-helix domain-containing protein [Cesiribacter sp. SM1]|uniref:winged helix-turn-helix transcriptional regulator n=1 Tax=Cesiribacter sp. SM1 TaxID=2861196 RepID=UPI001CD72060|nr:helix-turn-helix domain-containing protein [Cesiribacter sp. SM1]